MADTLIYGNCSTNCPESFNKSRKGTSLFYPGTECCCRKKNQLSAQDRSLVTALFYGVLERKITLDYVIQQYSNLKLNKISFDILSVLRMGVYQLAFMDAIPDSAAVNKNYLCWRNIA